MSRDYSQGKVYKIEPVVEHDEGDVYIGSTTQTYLSERMSQHRNGYNNYMKKGGSRLTSYSLFEKYGLGNLKIELIELVNATCKDELVMREAYFIRTIKCVNMCIPLRTDAEYRVENHDKIFEYSRIYNNKEKNKERASIWKKEQWIKIKADDERYEKVKEQCKEAKIKRDASMTEEEIEAQRIKTNEKLKEKIECICGVTITKGSKPNHLKTKKHQQFLESQMVAVECSQT